MNIEAVVLAAGYSSRAGTFKLNLDIAGKTVIERCVEGMVDICSRIVVVGGYQIDMIVEVLQKYPKLEVVLNSRYAEGMFTSVKEGMRHVQGDRFFFTGRSSLDQPGGLPETADCRRGDYCPGLWRSKRSSSSYDPKYCPRVAPGGRYL